MKYQFDKSKYKVYRWWHPAYLFWIINPGSIINELILGQRIPKLSLVDKTSGKSKFESSYTPCPHCNQLHQSKKWAPQSNTAFGNWFGLYCDNCGKTIPCLWSIWSWIIIVITSPLWIWYKKPLKEKWLKNQAKKFEELVIAEIKNPYAGKGWIKEGLGWAFFMFVFMNFVFPLIKEETVTLNKVLISIPIWILGGLSFGYTMKKFYNRQIKERESYFR